MKKMIFGLVFTSGVLAGTAGIIQSFARDASGEIEILDPQAIRLADGASDQDAQDQDAQAQDAQDQDAQDQDAQDQDAGVNGKEKDYWVGALIGPVPEPILVHISEDLLAEGKGVFLNEIVEGSPAEKAGLKQFDIVAKVGGETVDPESFIQKVRESKGEKLVCEVLRSGKVQTLELTPEVRPDQPNAVRPQPHIFRMPGGRLVVPNFEMPEDMKEMVPESLEEMPEMFDGEMFPEDFPIPEEVREMLRKQRGMFRQPNQRAVPNFQFHGGQKSHMQIEVTPNGTRVTRKMETEVDGEPLTILSKKEGEEPAELLIEWGEESYEITEEELDSLPEEIRGHVKSFLGSDSIQIHTDGLSTQPLPLPEGVAEEAAKDASKDASKDAGAAKDGEAAKDAEAVGDAETAKDAGAAKDASGAGNAVKDGVKANKKGKAENKKGKKKAAAKKSSSITAEDDAENGGSDEIPLDSKQIIDLR